MQSMHEFGRRLVVAEAEVEKLRHDLSASRGKLRRNLFEWFVLEYFD
jgi:hypothetical protein